MNTGRPGSSSCSEAISVPSVSWTAKSGAAYPTLVPTLAVGGAVVGAAVGSDGWVGSDVTSAVSGVGVGSADVSFVTDTAVGGVVAAPEVAVSGVDWTTAVVCGISWDVANATVLVGSSGLTVVAAAGWDTGVGASGWPQEMTAAISTTASAANNLMPIMFIVSGGSANGAGGYPHQLGNWTSFRRCSFCSSASRLAGMTLGLACISWKYGTHSSARPITCRW